MPGDLALAASAKDLTDDWTLAWIAAAACERARSRLLLEAWPR